MGDPCESPCATHSTVHCIKERLPKQIPCFIIIHKRMTICLVTYPFVCHVAISINSNHKRLETINCTQELVVFNKRLGEHGFNPRRLHHNNTTRPPYKRLCATSRTVQVSSHQEGFNIQWKVNKKGSISAPKYYSIPVNVFIVILEFGLTFVPCGITFLILDFISEVFVIILKVQIFERFCVLTSALCHF